mmetsp:Transcript_25697/g.67425  ORF Transcript_25697/g.67425 Transcript_25697/m.67425 type:complete len:214 (+) Transcript_25697:227-868(+)
MPVASFRRLLQSVNVKRERKYFRALGGHVLTLSGNVLRYACYIHVFTEYVCEVTLCVGPSMMPTLNQSGDVVLTESWTPRRGLLERGDVVVAVSPRNPNSAICKRVLGLPGDRVCINAGESGPRKFDTVPTGRVWLQGDNIYNSTDSRLYGAVPLGLVKARAFARVWPPYETCWLDRTLTMMDYGEDILPPRPVETTPEPEDIREIQLENMSN